MNQDTFTGAFFIAVGLAYLLLGERSVEWSNRIQDWFRARGSIGFGVRSARAHRAGAWVLVAIGVLILARA